MIVRVCALLGIGMGIAASAAAAQSASELCHSIADLETGHWAEFRLKGSQPSGITGMRYANVGNEDVDGTPHAWYEVTISGATNMVSQLLIPGRFGNIEDVHTIVLQMGGQPPMVMTGEMVQMAQQNGILAEFDLNATCERAETVGREEVTVPAGTFSAVHLRSGQSGQELWISDDLPFGLVRAITSLGDFELVTYGDGAESSIERMP